ncbi:hypothetical protein BDU57DRAFT_526718 [Ampelomyces quisqualis]|uniref:Nicotinamide-nucleotide adenylyltransferase n=1 Tax=Ampelomyces quisqualis TaxID=50730 RepID=A0A6A5R1Q6_AMPQU|nr:hypothetical protein BDU57DRAFT_526718 [Ampelomyces quisqualis]
MHFEDQTYVKQLDYSVFARWENVEALLVGLEADGAAIDELWDVREDMPIGSGDWSARVYPGLEVDVTCWKPGCWKDRPSDLDSDAEAEDEEEQRLLWEGARPCGEKRWWFGRWRMKVEQEAGEPVHEPGLRTMVLGGVAMATFVGLVLVVVFRPRELVMTLPLVERFCHLMAGMASRIANTRAALADLETALHSFTASASKFRIVRTVNATATQPRTLYILDSSFNPPSAAHLALAAAALQQHAVSESAPCRLLLLFSTHNADKAPSPASFVQRLALMAVFAADVSRHLPTPPPIDIGLTKEPYFSDKSAAITHATPRPYPSDPVHVHLVGFDTLTRFCNPQYYPAHDPPLSALQPFFAAGHRLRVTPRPSDPSDASSTDFGAVDAQQQYLQSLRAGGLQSTGFQPAWGANIDMAPAGEGVGISSTRVRAAAKEGSLAPRPGALQRRRARHQTHGMSGTAWPLLPGWHGAPSSGNHSTWLARAVSTTRRPTVSPPPSSFSPLLLLTPTMASKLCCTAEEEGRSGSPVLPNARVSAPTPADRPLLSTQTGSPHSHFTSARSDELHELRQIFDSARDDASGRASPPKAPRPRSSRPSIYSLHSLHKMTSMRSILRRKFSKDLSRKNSRASTHGQFLNKAIDECPDTMLKHPKADPQQQFKVTKDNLRNHLLSDKAPAEGGYDSDAQVLDDVARDVGKKTPSKRPSIHSVDWAPSTGSISKSTPVSASERRCSTEIKRHVQPYQIQKPQLPSLSARLAQVFSTPNLRVDEANEHDRKLRRSHSATSMGLPKPSPISPLRLPSLTDHDQNGVPWSEIMSESLRLSQFPVPPCHASLKPSKTFLVGSSNPSQKQQDAVTEHVRDADAMQSPQDTILQPSARAIEIRIQQPTSVASPRPSTSVRRNFRENAPPVTDTTTEAVEDESEGQSHRRSVHLYSMRISHHLRSGSLLSWDQLADAPDLPAPPLLFRQRTVSDQSRFPNTQAQLARHERQTSSSGFASNKVPTRWGRVLPHDRDLRADVASSIYSSRPQSPLDSFVGSMVNLSRAGSGHQNFSHSSVDLRKLRRSISFPTDNEETPRPAPRYGVTNAVAAQDCEVDTSLLTSSFPLARKNSVADTKKSKFREEFSPSPPRKKLTPSASIMKFLNPKRLSLRSLSEANLQSETPSVGGDGHFDTLPVPADRERRQSRSLISLQMEQDALGKNKGANHVWDKALKAHQEEKASMFLPQNKDLAIYASPFRERSGSMSSRRPSHQEDLDPVAEASSPKPLSAPRFATNAVNNQAHEQMASLSRRSATAGRIDLSLKQEVAEAFDKQGDDTDVVGAWGRYPSHTRAERTLSIGKRDHVQARDFALEAAIKFASAGPYDYDEDMIDPTDRLPSPPLLPGEKKRKKRVGTGKMAKSHSMTFGRRLIKNYYSGMFKSSSTEFRQHGRGHRSSIASGGTLEHPELELLPEVFMVDATDGAGDRSPAHNHNQVVRRHSERNGDSMANGKLPIKDSMATLRPRRNSSAPNLNELTNVSDQAGDHNGTEDRARVWSTYYETCVTSFPRVSTDAGFALEDFGGPSHISYDSKRASMHSHTMPSRHGKHSRNPSQLSRRSTMSRGSAQLNVFSLGGDENDGDTGSLVSVRRSTMDLISKFKEQERTERERVLSLTRAESRREAALLAAL